MGWWWLNSAGVVLRCGSLSELGSSCLNEPFAFPGGFGAGNRDSTSEKLTLNSCSIQHRGLILQSAAHPSAQLYLHPKTRAMCRVGTPKGPQAATSHRCRHHPCLVSPRKRHLQRPSEKELHLQGINCSLHIPSLAKASPVKLNPFCSGV